MTSSGSWWQVGRFWRTASRGGLVALAVFIGALAGRPAAAQSEAQMAAAREQMVRQVIVGGGITNPGVIESMRMTPRHFFVAPQHRMKAYLDMALPIGDQQTISSPYIVAFMTQTLEPQPDDRVLEIGTGSGFQAAVLSPLVKDVYSIEIVEELGQRAAQTLEKLGYRNIHTKIGDGFEGWAENAPFDAIIVTCSPESVPKPLVEQLKEGGRMIIPVGERYQQTLYRMRKVQGKLQAETLQPTLFVPMTGAAEDRRRKQPDPTKPLVVNGDFELAPLVPGQLGKKGGGAAGAAQDAAGGQPGAADGGVAGAVAGGGNIPRSDDGPFIAGWYYQRQARLGSGPPIPSGKQYALFENADLGRDSHILQGLAVDGSKIQRLWLSAQVKCADVRTGPVVDMAPNIIVTFYDKERRELSMEQLGPWNGTFDWQQVAREIRVPAGAREAILRVGLFGAVGTMGIDQIQLSTEAPQGERADRPAGRRARDRRSRRDRASDRSQRGEGNSAEETAPAAGGAGTADGAAPGGAEAGRATADGAAADGAAAADGDGAAGGGGDAGGADGDAGAGGGTDRPRGRTRGNRRGTGNGS